MESQNQEKNLSKNLSQKEPDLLEIEKDLVSVLRLVYERVQWHKIAHSFDHQSDLFSHDLLQACSEDSVPEFLHRLCYSLGVQSIPSSPETVDAIRRLNAQRKEVLRYVYHNATFLVILVEDSRR